MRSKRNHASTKVLAVVVLLLLFGLASPVIADDYVEITSGTHDIDYAIGGYLGVSNATVNLLTGSHIIALAGDGDLVALDNSIINIKGGIIDGITYITSTAIVTVYGSNFELDGAPVASDVNEIYNPGPSYVNYVLTGTFEDGNDFSINLSIDPDARIHLNQPQPKPEITVYPSDFSHDYGDLAIGDSNTYVVQIQNVGNADLEVSSVTLDPNGSADFTITSAPAMPFTIAPSNTILVDIEITYTPSVEGYVTTKVLIESDDADEALVEVELSGMGIIVEVPPAQQIQDIIAFYNQSLGDGTIVGYGPGNSPKRRVKALRCMLKAAGFLINREHYNGAIRILRVVDRKTDGEGRPQDFVVGENVPTLNTMVNDLIDDLNS